MTKRTASELWDALDEATVDAELESALEKTPEENRRELVEAGFDLDTVHAEADAFFASLPAEARPAPASPQAEAPSAPTATAKPPAPPPATAALSATAPSPATATPATAPPRVWRMRIAIAVPTALALAAGVAVAIQSSSPSVVGTPPPRDTLHAMDLRREARDACESRSWKTCLDKLDEARALDPSGNETPEVQSLRHAATAGAGHP
jgi:hypothetical protein